MAVWKTFHIRRPTATPIFQNFSTPSHGAAKPQSNQSAAIQGDDTATAQNKKSLCGLASLRLCVKT
jgi:hypothetical protein